MGSYVHFPTRRSIKGLWVHFGVLVWESGLSLLGVWG